jgi:hypothetical protein
MQTQTRTADLRSVVPPCADLVSAFSAERRSGAAPSPTTFLDCCSRCGGLLPPRRRRYCSDECAHAAHLVRTRAWKRTFRQGTGRWPNPASDYWPPEKRRLKNREYSRRHRERRRSALNGHKKASPGMGSRKGGKELV